MRLIDADALMYRKQFRVGKPVEYLGKFDILSASTVDAVSVVHGRWEKECNFYFCSECDFAIHEDFMDVANYCPSCGAKMDKEADHE